MTWYAIKGPDGKFIATGEREGIAWSNALIDFKLYCVFNPPRDYESAVRASNALGYRCVEVQLVEKVTQETTEAL